MLKFGDSPFTLLLTLEFVAPYFLSGKGPSLTAAFCSSDRTKLVNLSIPIVLAVSTEDKERLAACSEIALTYNGAAVAVLEKPEFYTHRKLSIRGGTFFTLCTITCFIFFPC